MSFVIEWDARGAHCRHIGEASQHTVFSALTAVHAHPDFDQFRYAIHDFLAVTRIPDGYIDMSDIIAQHLGALVTNPALCTAVVVNNPRLLELARIWREQGAGQMGIFSTLEAARLWLVAVGAGGPTKQDQTPPPSA